MNGRATGIPAAGGRWRRAAAILALLGAAACGGCDQTESLPCRFEVEADGSRRMTCPDGTSTVFPAPVVAPRHGAVVGQASRFGDPRRDGLDVWLTLAPSRPQAEPASLHARTDADGRFRFDDLPPGSHVVSIRSAGYQGVDLPVVVDPGAYVLDPVVLRRGLESLAGQGTTLVPSPRGDAFLVLYGDGDGDVTARRLVYWQPDGHGMVPIAERVQGSGGDLFDAGGGLVHVLDRPTSGPAALIRYEVDSGRRVAIATDVRDFDLALDGEALVFVGSDRRLRGWNERFASPDGTGTVRTIAAGVEGYQLGPHGRLLVFHFDSLMVTWDMAEMTGDALGDAREMAFSPDGAVLIALRGSELLAWDADAPRLVRLGEGEPDSISFHDSGRRFVFLRREGSSLRLLHVDLDGGARPELLSDRVSAASYGPGAGGIAWVEPGAAGPELRLSAGPGEVPETLGRGEEIGALTWSRDGRRLFFGVLGPDGVYHLDVHEAGVGTHQVAPEIVGLPTLEPDGDGVFFFVPNGGTVALDYWSPALDEPIRVHDAVDPMAGPFEVRAGPGSRLLVPDQDGGWWRWDPDATTTTAVGSVAPQGLPRYRFLGDGGVLFAGDDARLTFLAPDASEPRTVGTGLPAAQAPFGGIYGGSRDGGRFSYLVDTVDLAGNGAAGTLVLFDRATGAAIPLDDGVRTAVQGDRFVAYVRDVADPENPQRLFLVTYPVE